MLIPLELREGCPQGELTYVCASNGFNGCCAVDPCALKDGCPKGSGSTASANSPAAGPTSASKTGNPSLSQSSKTNTAIIQGSTDVRTSATVDSSGRTIIQLVTVTQGASQTSRPPSTNTPASTAKGPSPVGGIVGGVIGGIAVIALVVFLLFYLRRKKQAKRRSDATVSQSYTDGDGDMSSHLATGFDGHHSITTEADSRPISEMRGSLAGSDKAFIGNPHDEKKARFTTGETHAVPQLDATMIREMGGDPLGSIPELPAPETNPFATPQLGSAEIPEKPQQIARKNGDREHHVMSWAQFDSETSETHHPAFIESPPQQNADVSSGLWATLAPVKTNTGGDEKKD